jgi:quercetin dioxygenase-like cupin family protein
MARTGDDPLHALEHALPRESRDTRRPEMASLDTRQQTERARFDDPDEVREFPHGRAEIVKVGGGEVGRFTFEPGWRWSDHVKPIAGTDSCEAPHFQYHVSGRVAILMDDGTELIAGPGDVTSLPSGHDAWVVGDEPVVVIDWYGASNYANGG